MLPGPRLWVLGIPLLLLGLSQGCTRVAECPSPKPVDDAMQADEWNRTAVYAPRVQDVRAASEPAHEVPASFQAIQERAKALAASPEAGTKEMQLPPALRAIDYDDYRKIRFRPERSLWRDEPGRFEVQFFHAGFYYRDMVAVSVVENGGARSLPFSTEWFSYDGVPVPPPNAGLGFTGLRLHAPLNSETYRDEVIVFHGASYFRPVARGNVYGLSARGLAIDFGESHPEEFPRFSELYLVRPGPDDDFMWILALLESPRATGAYAFRIQPGDPTAIEVTAELFLREPGSVLGLAPLTSMYLFGEDEPNRFGDFRPEVHDSDGLAVHGKDGEWLYRPLRNPVGTSVATFRLDSPKGFGLVQRDVAFESYQDLEARYQDRPSVWVEPLRGFDQGSVRLLEFETDLETTDNITAAWVPDAPAENLTVQYRLLVGRESVLPRPAASVTATRIGKTKQGGRFLVDFSGRKLEQKEDVEVVISATRGRVLEQHVEVNPFTSGLRASFEVAPDAGARDVELRAFLRSHDDTLTETWSYLWQPKV